MLLLSYHQNTIQEENMDHFQNSLYLPKPLPRIDFLLLSDVKVFLINKRGNLILLEYTIWLINLSRNMALKAYNIIIIWMSVVGVARYMSWFFSKRNKLDTVVRIFRNFQFYYRFTIIYRTICDCVWATKEKNQFVYALKTVVVEGHILMEFQCSEYSICG